MTERTLRLAAVSPPVRVGDLEHNLLAVRRAITTAVDAGAGVIVGPELVSSGYVFHDLDEARAASMPRDDARWESIIDVVPTGSVCVIGFAEHTERALFNSAAVVSAAGLIAVYRKSHLWGQEARFFAPGDEAGIVVDTPACRLGVAVCYDNEFPEVPRSLALRGAELLALPVNWPRVQRPRREHAPETIQAMAAARSSRLPTVIADRRGRERGVDWTGGSAVIDGDGWLVARGTTAPMLIADVRVGRDKSLPPHNDLFGDRRPDLYATGTSSDESIR